MEKEFVVCSGCGREFKQSALCVPCENEKMAKEERGVQAVFKLFENLEFVFGSDGSLVTCRPRAKRHKALRVAIISCVKKKRRGTHRARDLYTSYLFRASLRYALKHFDRVCILSAKYGLLSLDDRITSYDINIKSMSGSQRRGWAEQTAAMILNRVPKDSRISFFCGGAYRKELIPFIEKKFDITVPLKGLSIGKQLQWYKAHEAKCRH